MAQERLSSILSYLDDVEGDNDGNARPNRDLSAYTQRASQDQNVSSKVKSNRKYIWDDWDEGDDNHMSSIYEGRETTGDMTPGSNSSMSTISPEPSHRGASSFISPIHHEHQTHDDQESHNDNQSQSQSQQSRSVTANAFRDVQVKIKAMQEELDERSEEVLVKERELQNVRLASETSIKALEVTWKGKNEDQHYHSQAALERQRDFQRTLANDVDKLKDKQEALSEQISRIIRRRDGEIGGARRQTVSKLRSEREQWVNLERSKLAKLADSKTDAMKTAAVEELEPVLTELIRKQRLEMRDIEVRLKDEFAINVRKHRIQLQRSKDSSDVEARYSKSMSKEREGWSREFKGMMSKCEDDAVKLRQQHDQNMCNERESHDHMWRQIMAKKESQVEEVRSEAATKASKLTQYHNRNTLELAERHAIALQRARALGLVLEQSTHNRVKQEVVEDRTNLDSKVLAQLKSKAMRELVMVEEKLERQFADEYSALEGELAERRVKLSNELESRLQAVSSCNDEEEDGDSKSEENKEDVHSKVEKLKKRLENDNEEIDQLESEISEIRGNRAKQESALTSMNRELSEKIAATLNKVQELERQASAEALSVCRRKEALHDEYKQQVTSQETELSTLREDLALELVNVRGRVDAVLNRKEEKAAELADTLSDLTKLNDKRAGMLNKLRQGRFQ